MYVFLSVLKVGSVWRWDESCLVHLNHWFWAEESLLLFVCVVVVVGSLEDVVKNRQVYIYIYICV